MTSRKQRAGESGLEYALDKVQLCRLSPMPLDYVQIIPFLINGLNRWEHAAALTVAMPVTVSDFLERMRDLERFGSAAQIDTVSYYAPPVHASSFVPSAQAPPLVAILPTLPAQPATASFPAPQMPDLGDK